MKVSQIYINNFKAYRNTVFHANESLNVITGTNNSGKTTILEAIALWHECFSLLLMKAKKSTAGTNIRQGDYRLGKKAQNYFDYRAIHSVRSYRFNDIFYELTISNVIEIGLSFIDKQMVSKEICFRIRGASGSSNYEILLKDHDKFDFEWFNNAFKYLPEPIGCYFALPIAVIPAYEEFATRPIIKNRVTSRETSSYIRNRIYLLHKQKDIFQSFVDDISFILSNRGKAVNFKVESDIDRDTNISVNIRIGLELSYKDVSLLGSGTLQIIGLLLTCYEEEKDLSLILLDEPDSHIHRDIQKRLIYTLQKKTAATQIFITTHNEGLIRSSHPSNIFHIDDGICTTDKTEIKPIISDVFNQRQKGASVDHHSSVISKVHATSSLDIIGFIEADTILLVEGIDDIKFIQQIISQYGLNINCAFWSFKGIDSLIREVKHFKSFLDGVGASECLWKKTKIIIDSDYLSREQISKFIDKTKAELSIDVFAWSSYTIESSILTDKDAFTAFISALIENDVLIPKIPTVEVKQHIENCWKNHIDMHLERLDDMKYTEKVTNQLSARGNNIKKFLIHTASDIRKIFGCNENMLYPTYRDYSRNLCCQNDISHSCSKSDLNSFFDNLFSSILASQPQIDDYFTFSLEHISICQFYGFSELNKAIAFIKK
ncbi:ATP-dependent nuclease [Aeromonas salmonicida]|uniref:ATP-dependent nuclease n=1 Tax=Aeromonas salmonicida TaxID=645 RepID=UPI00223F8E68|nr:ATP-binding protein [Aeromonas salmonicida]